MKYSAIELCAGGGGQALGLEMAGFQHAAAVEYEPQFCATLLANRPKWNVINKDIRDLRPADFTGLDLLAAGVPCPPFSIAGKQLGGDDERDMFPTALSLVEGARPRAILSAFKKQVSYATIPNESDMEFRLLEKQVNPILPCRVQMVQKRLSSTTSSPTLELSSNPNKSKRRVEAHRNGVAVLVNSAKTTAIKSYRTRTVQT